MVVRNDIMIDWSQSPRIIEVAVPSVELTVQDLYDTLRSLATEAIDEPEITDGSGKETLSATELVGLTVKLFNAKVKFEDRTSPTDCNISGGNLVALDVNGMPMNPIQYATYVTVTYAKSSSATLVQSASIEDLHDVALGKWVLNPTAKTMTMYKADGITVLKTFNLTDTAQKVPAFIERTPV